MNRVEQSFNQRLDFSPVSRGIIFIILSVCISALLSLSLGWSMSETQRVTDYAFGLEYGLWAAWLIQLGPQALLTVRALTVDRLWRQVLLVLSLVVFNLVDATTNIVAVYTAVPSLALPNPVLVQTAVALSYLFAFGITWAEELLIYLAGTALEVLARLWTDLGGQPPRFFRAGASIASHASGASAINEVRGRSGSNRRA